METTSCPELPEYLFDVPNVHHGECTTPKAARYAILLATKRLPVTRFHDSNAGMLGGFRPRDGLPAISLDVMAMVRPPRGAWFIKIVASLTKR